MKYVVSTMIFYALAAFGIVMTINLTENWIGFVVFSLIMCVIVTFFNLRLYYKELEKKKDGDNGNRDAKEKEEKKKEK